MNKRKNQSTEENIKKIKCDGSGNCFNTIRKIIVRNDDDPHVFLDTTQFKSSPYVKIGTHVYKTKEYDERWTKYNINSKEYVGLTIAQYNECEPYIFNRMVLISDFNTNVAWINNLSVNLSTNSTFKIVTKKNNISDYILNMLDNHIVGYGQKILMNYMGLLITIKIMNIDNTTIGKITSTTKIKFNEFNDNIVICNKCITLDSKFINVDVRSCVSLDGQINFPIIIERKTIDKYVRDCFTNAFTDNDSKTYKYGNIEYQFKIKSIIPDKQTKYKNIYRLKSDNKLINVESSTSNLVIIESIKKAEKICLSVGPIKLQKYSINDRILNVDDIMNYISQNVKSITTKQQIKYLIPNTYKEVALNINYISPQSNDKTMYKLVPNESIVTFDTETKSSFILVHNKNPYEIKRVTFKVIKSVSGNIFDILFGATNNKIQHINSKKLERLVRMLFPNKTALKHRMEITHNGMDFIIVVKELEFVETDIPKSKYATYGLITDKTEFKFVTSPKNKFFSINTGANAELLKDPIGEMEKYVGGLTEELNIVIRNICLSRGKLREEFIKRGLKPVRGIILHGPPGVGKTALARQLGKLLGCEGDRFKLMSGPEIFNKWVGESEANIREIFKPAKEAWKKYGDKSPIYMVVIDEIDAMLPVRGISIGNSIRDTVVNQFLAEMDGLDQFNNLIVVGITNLLQLIDPAILRPGRFGVHIKVNLPKRDGRKKIFEIHAKQLIELNRLENIDFEKLVDMTDGYSGADIEAIIEMASTYSLERLNKMDVINEEVIATSGKITQSDFDRAIRDLRRMKGDDYSRHLFI